MTRSSSASPPPKSRPRRASSRRRAWPWLVLLLAAAGLIWAFWPDPEGDLLDELQGRGYELNVGFAAHYQPGTVVRVARGTAAGGEERLPAPEVALWPEQCFPGQTPRSAAFALPTSSGRRSLKLDAARFHKLLPKLGIEGAKSWKVELGAPRSKVFATLGNLSEQFSPLCLERLERALDAGEKLAWYRTLTEAVVAEGLRIEIEWSAGSSGTLREAAQQSVKKGLGGNVDAAFASQEQKVLEVKGEIVLAYRWAEMEPVGVQTGGGRP